VSLLLLRRPTCRGALIVFSSVFFGLLQPYLLVVRQYILQGFALPS
jgi:hypothetical protein